MSVVWGLGIVLVTTTFESWHNPKKISNEYLTSKQKYIRTYATSCMFEMGVGDCIGRNEMVAVRKLFYAVWKGGGA